MNVSRLNNHHVEQGRTGTKLQAGKSSRPSYTPTTNSETMDKPIFYFFSMAITFKKKGFKP